MKPHTRAILERYDEPGSYEFHSEFDYPEMEARALLVERDLIATGVSTVFEGEIYNQDASFSIAILLDVDNAPGVTSGAAIRFSNFGNLATVIGQERLPVTLLAVIGQALRAHGFQAIPAQDLDCVYDGVMPDACFHSWRARYFDWI